MTTSPLFIPPSSPLASHTPYTPSVCEHLWGCSTHILVPMVASLIGGLCAVGGYLFSLSRGQGYE